VRITHPFQAFGDRQLLCVGERYNRSGKRLLLRADDTTVCSVPPQWTDAVTPDAEVLMGEGVPSFGSRTCWNSPIWCRVFARRGLARHRQDVRIILPTM
jgi:hypothetical protein